MTNDRIQHLLNAAAAALGAEEFNELRQAFEGLEMHNAALVATLLCWGDWIIAATQVPVAGKGWMRPIDFEAMYNAVIASQKASAE